MNDNKGLNILMKIKKEDYDLERYIAEVRKNYLAYGYPETCIPCLFNESDSGKFYMNTDFYSRVGYNKILTMEQISYFLNNYCNAAIHICFAHGDMEGNILMANGMEYNISNIETGHIIFKEGNSFGVNIKINGEELLFEQVEYSIDEGTFAPVLERVHNSGQLRNMALALIEKFKK